MATMAGVARRYGLYVIASNTQAPFRLTRNAAAVAALGEPGLHSVYAPTNGVAYDQTFLWGPRDVSRGAPAPLANLLADNYKVPLTSFEQALGFKAGPSGAPLRGATCAPSRSPAPGHGSGSPPACRRSSTGTRPRRTRATTSR